MDSKKTHATKAKLAYRQKMAMVPTEDQEQIKLATWLKKKNVLFYAIPNQGARDARYAFKLKRCGVMAGVPDICIVMARGAYNGLYIELKRQMNGVVSDNQRYWIESLNKEGYLAVVCKGADEAIKTIEDYLQFDKKKS